MRKGDLIWLAGLLGIVLFLLYPSTHEIFVRLTKGYPYIMGFIKVAILATLGELLALRIIAGEWRKPFGLSYRAFIWGLLGISFVLVFEIFASGTAVAVKKGLLPMGGGIFANVLPALFTSAAMNIIFAPTMMAFHRVTDTYIDLAHGELGNLNKVTLQAVVSKIDWQNFVGFVIVKTIPLFWIPAHTITFLLPPEYRVLSASFLSIALGAILAFAKKTSNK
ncbi:Mpv17/PMP22 family protein [Sporomusa malonica]|uniref:Mpv17 / PMP22 family protein n=1 Tax=Sporomusa malonica TaxID=112901 RepID=A0A1W2C2B8_9FIRM|nr:Mpv17/PMP22 family protein [Sporomusa malonica]SMC79313.1 Mpv17 / PMP22 family protein [Sporomusa malonica]